MADKDEEVFQRVQAALLDSECPPREAVEAALDAIAQFAAFECEMDFGDWADVGTDAWASTGEDFDIDEPPVPLSKDVN